MAEIFNHPTIHSINHSPLTNTKMKVLKFGGTSVGSAGSIKTVLSILQQQQQAGKKPVTVLSAMSGVTNLLVQMAENAAVGQSFTAQLADLEHKHFEVVRELMEVQTQNPVFTRLKIY